MRKLVPTLPMLRKKVNTRRCPHQISASVAPYLFIPCF
jgi:hypothetical protein